MAQKNFRAMAQTLIFRGFEPWLKATFDMQILTSNRVDPNKMNKDTEKNESIIRTPGETFRVKEVQLPR